MKSKLIETNETINPIVFPILMEWVNPQGSKNKLVVWFSSLTSGIVVYPDENHFLGQRDNHFYPATDNTRWKPFNGKIELSN